jgi:hypothetical protein
MNKFLNENWRVVYSEMGKEILMVFGEVLFSILMESAKIVPFKEIFNDVE